jgi:hypothetical protein
MLAGGSAFRQCGVRSVQPSLQIEARASVLTPGDSGLS